MKKIRMGFMAIVAISGIGNALAFSPKQQAITYYARQTVGNSFHWTTTIPNPSTAQCITATNRICEITTTTAPVDDEIPAGHVPIGYIIVSI